MQPIPDIHYHKFKDFKVKVTEIYSYEFMDFEISLPNKEVKYSAGGITKPLNELLSAVAALLTDYPFPYSEWRQLNNNFIVTHDLEGRFIYWLINYEENSNLMTVLIWLNECEDVIKDWCLNNFDSEKYFSHTGGDELPDLTTSLAFAIQDIPHDFVKNLLEICSEIDRKYAGTFNKGDWGFTYPELEHNLLENWLKVNQKIQ